MRGDPASITSVRHFFSRYNSFDCPPGMFGNQWLGIMARFLQGRQGAGVSCISQGDTDIPQQTAAFGAKHRRAGKSLLETRLIELKQFDQIWRSEFFTGVRLHQIAFLCKTIPWTGGETIVTPKNAIADERAQFHRN